MFFFYYIRTYVLIQVPDYGKYFFIRREHYEIRNAENQSHEILKGQDNRTRKKGSQEILDTRIWKEGDGLDKEP